MREHADLLKNRRRNAAAIYVLAAAVVILAFVCLFVGSSHMSISDCFAALLKKGSMAQVRIIWNIRIPRVLAAIIAGAGLSVSGLVMQTDLNNPMASPSTLGVSNAAVFGANLSIIAFAGGFLSTGNNLLNYTVGANPYATSLMAFLFSTASILLILGLCRLRAFQPGVVVLAGIPSVRSGRRRPLFCSSTPRMSGFPPPWSGPSVILAARHTERTRSWPRSCCLESVFSL